MSPRLSEPDVDQELLAEIRDHVLWLTLNRPDAGNAITPAVRNRMIEHLADASSSYDVRAIVLTAAGEKHFCTGADLRAGRAAPPPRPEGAPERPAGEAARMIRTGIQRLIGAMLDCDKPIIAAVNGTAAGRRCRDGAGVGPGDRGRARAASSRCSCAAASSPTAAAPTSFPASSASRSAKELVFFGDDLAAADAERIGLGEPRRARRPSSTAAATEWATRLAQGPTKTIGFAKQLLNRSLDVDRATVFEEEALYVELVVGDRGLHRGRRELHRAPPDRVQGW